MSFFSPSPTAPTPLDPSTFRARAIALFDWIRGTMIDEMETLNTEVKAAAAALTLNSVNDSSVTSNTIGTGTKTFKQGLYNYETPLSTTKNMHPDPADHLYGGKNILDIVNGKQDPHDIGSSENKADLDSIRQILFDNKITQNYGDNITPEQWKKAMSIPKIANEPHVVRMRKNYKDIYITDLNNTIAKNPNINDKSTMA